MQSEIKKIADFWIEKSFQTPVNKNNGDDSPTGGLVFALAGILTAQSQDATTKEQIEAFRKELTKMLEENPRLVLSCDYGPNAPLQKAAEISGVDSGCFPWKTTTRLDHKGKAVASYGYGAAFSHL